GKYCLCLDFVWGPCCIILCNLFPRTAPDYQKI
ncbi:Photosystem II protein PsbT, partial [uncultured Synechococcales cyanobacterium]